MRHRHWVDWTLAAVSAVAFLNLYAFITRSWWGETLADDVVALGWMVSVGACIYAYALWPRSSYRTQGAILLIGLLYWASYATEWLAYLILAPRLLLFLGVLSVPLTPALVLSVKAARRAVPA